jgi:hypothetical protein
MTIPYTQREKCELIERFHLCCSVAQFDKLVEELRRGFEERERRESALQRMTEDAEALGLYTTEEQTK